MVNFVFLICKIIMLIKLIKQAISFFGISGIGWIIDFGVFYLLGLTGMSYSLCNIISSLCGVTFVFFISTKKTFDVNLKKLKLYQKYIIYIVYQIFMILLSSWILGIINKNFELSNIEILSKYSGIIAKICITPFTMLCNFIFMKFLSEKL